MYDKMATNPFTDTRRMVIVWVEEPETEVCKTENQDKSGAEG